MTHNLETAKALHTSNEPLQPLRLAQISVGDMDNNVYLIWCGEDALLIDAADDAHAIMELAAREGVKITHVLTTHRHHDHVRALRDILHETKALHVAPFLDAPALPADVDIELEDGEYLVFKGHNLPVHILRGHTPGGAAIAFEIDGVPHIAIGDSLFPGGLGKTAGENEFERLFGDVTTKIFDNYPDETVILPGHGKSTTLGAERPHLHQWWERRW